MPRECLRLCPTAKKERDRIARLRELEHRLFSTALASSTNEQLHHVTWGVPSEFIVPGDDGDVMGFTLDSPRALDNARRMATDSLASDAQAIAIRAEARLAQRLRECPIVHHS